MPGRISKEKGTNTMCFDDQNEIPSNRQRDVTYARIVFNYRDQKKEKERTRLSMGGIELIILLTAAHQPQSFSPSNSYSIV